MRTRGERRHNNNRIKQKVINRVLALNKIYHSRYFKLYHKYGTLIEPFDIEFVLEKNKIYIGKEGKNRLRHMRRKNSYKSCAEANCTYCLRGKLHNYFLLEEKAKYEYEDFFNKKYSSKIKKEAEYI